MLCARPSFFKFHLGLFGQISDLIDCAGGRACDVIDAFLKPVEATLPLFVVHDHSSSAHPKNPLQRLAV